MHMVPAIRNILGGFLFSGDDVDKPVRVLSGGERTRLAVARMLLRPSNTLLLDEPTNHLDLDSKDVLLEALEDFGGTLVFVSHDRYFVDKLATKVIEIGNGGALLYPGNYEEFLWSRKQQFADTAVVAKETKTKVTQGKTDPAPPQGTRGGVVSPKLRSSEGGPTYEEKKRQDAEERKARKAESTRKKRIDDLETRIAEREREIKEIEAAMSAPGFYENRDASKPVIDRHQALMWEVGDLMGQWETLQEE
jgi:ATP-binding cassette subfamily F protein 3